MKELAKAMADYGRAIEAAPSFHHAYYNRAYLRIHTGELNGALADADVLLKLDPDTPKNHVLRADIRRIRGDLAGAAADASRAIGLDPKHARAWYARSMAREQAGDLAGSWQDLQRSLELNPTDAATLDRAERLTEKLEKQGGVALAPPTTKQAPPTTKQAPPATKQAPPVVVVAPPRVIEPPIRPRPSPPPHAPAKPVKFLPSDPDNVATWNLPDTPWRKGDQPLPAELSDDQLKALATKFDVAKLDYSEFHRAVTTAMACMRLVHGDMEEEDVRRLYAKWAPILEFPSPEAVEYFNKLNPLLLEFLKTRGALMVALNMFDRAWEEAGVAAGFENLDAMADALADAAASKDTAASLRERLAQIGSQIEALGDPPNPYAAQHARRRVLRARLERATAVRIVPSKQEVAPGAACQFKPVVKDAPPKARFEWTFGDGVAAAKAGADTVAHKYEKLGKYQVKLTVRDLATGRVVGQSTATASVAAAATAPAAPTAGKYVMISHKCFLKPGSDRARVSIGAPGNFVTVRNGTRPNDPYPGARYCALKYSWTHPPGCFDPQAPNPVQIKTAIEVVDNTKEWDARQQLPFCSIRFFHQHEWAEVEGAAVHGKRWGDDPPAGYLLLIGDHGAYVESARTRRPRPPAMVGDKEARRFGGHQQVGSYNTDITKFFPITERWTGPVDMPPSGNLPRRVSGADFPYAVVVVELDDGTLLCGYACYVYAFDPTGQKRPIALEGSKDTESMMVEQPVASELPDPQSARLDELRQDIEFTQGNVERWRAEAAAERDPTRAKELRNRIVDALSEITRAEDMIASLQTGTIVRRRTLAEDMQFHQLIESCHQDVLRSKAIMENARRMGEMQKAFRRGVGNLHQLIAMLDDEDAKTCREWASKKLDAKAMAELDTAKLKRMTNAMLAKVQGQTFRREAEAMDMITTLEEVKFTCDLALIVVAPYAAAEGIVAESAFLTHAPGIIATGYGCGTGYIEGGVKGAILTGLRFKFAAVDVAVAALDGYRSEEGGSLTGAAKYALFTLLMRKGCEMSANRIVKERLAAAAAAAARPAKVRAWREFVKDANFGQDKQHGENLVGNYQQANNAFVEMASQKKPPGQTMEEFLAANAEALAATPEGRALTDAMAQVECSYTAKMAFQSNNVSGAAKQSYNRNLGLFLEKPVIARVKQLMKEMGWNDFELMQFRHSANKKKVGFDKDIGVKEEGWEGPKKNGEGMRLLDFQKDLNKCIDKAFREKAGGRHAAAADWRGTTCVDEEAYLDKTVLELKELSKQGINPMSKLEPALADQTGQVNVNKVRHALAKGTREGQAEAFRSTAKEIETKIIDNLPDGSADKAYFQEVLAIAKEGATDPHAAVQKLKSFTGSDIHDLALQVKQQLVHMVGSAPR